MRLRDDDRDHARLAARAVARNGGDAGALSRRPRPRRRRSSAAIRDTKSTDRLAAVLGPDSDEIISSGDPVEDAAARKRFATAAAEHTRIESLDDATAIVHVGKDDWPLPIPIVHDADGWRFDAAAGKEELLNRRIGRNELDGDLRVPRLRRRAARVRRAGSIPTRRTSAARPGKQDGLYWEETDHDASPLGPLVAAATAEGYQLRRGDGRRRRPTTATSSASSPRRAPTPPAARGAT